MRVRCVLAILVVTAGLIGSQLSVNQALIAGFAGIATGLSDFLKFLKNSFVQYISKYWKTYCVEK